MADDPTGSNLLMSMGLDLSPVKAAADVIKTTLDNLNALAAQVATTATGAAKTQTEQMGQLKTQAQAAVAAAKAAIAAENAKAAAIKTQTAELGKQQAEQKAATAAAQAGVAAHKEKQAAAQAETAEIKTQTAELQRQTAELRKQALEMRVAKDQARETAGAEAEGGGRGPFGRATGLFSRIAAGMMGQGIAGSVAGGVLAGEGIAAAVEGAGEAIERFIDKLKEISIEEGSIVELQKVFDALARGAGVNAAQALDRLSGASEGLVNRITLLRVATMALRSPYKITMDQTEELAHDITILAEASGHTAEEGMQALYSSLARGRPYMLGAVTGVAALRDVMRDIPTSLGPIQRGMVEWQRALGLLHKQADALGELPDTFEKMASRMKIAAHNAMLSFGTGFNEAFAGRTVGGDIAQTVVIFKDMEIAAQKMGAAVGSALARITHAVLRADAVLHEFAGSIKMIAGLAISWGVIELTASMGKFVSETLAGVRALTQMREALMLLQFTQMATSAQGAESAAVSALPKVTSLGQALRLLKTNPQLAEQVAAAGVAAGEAAPKVGLLSSAFAGLRSVMGGIITALGTLLVYFTYRFTNDWRRSLSATQGQTVTWGDVMHGVFRKIADVLAVSAGDMDRLSASTKSWSDHVKEAQQARLAAEHEKKKFSPFGGEGITTGRRYTSEAEAYAAQFFGESISLPIPTGIPDESIQEMNRRAQARMQAQMELAKAQLQARKDEIAQEKEIDTEAYSYQNETAKEHYANLSKIADESYQADRKEAMENFAAQDAMYAARAKSGEDSYQDYLLNRQKLQEQYNSAMEKADFTHTMALKKIDDESNRDRLQAYLKRVQSEAQLHEEELKRNELTTKDVRYGGVTPDEMLQSQIQTIRDISENKIREANRVYAATKQNEDALQIRADAINKAIEDAQTKLDDLQQSAPSVRLQAIQWAFQPQQQAIESQIAGLRPGENPGQLQRAMLDNLQKQRQALEAAIQTATPYSDIWNQIFSQIQKTYEMQQKYNDELRKSHDLLQPISESLSSMTKLIGTVWTSHFVQGLTASLGGGIASLQGATEARNKLLNAFHPGSAEVPKDPHMLALEKAADSTANSFANVKTGTSGATKALDSFTQAVQGARDWLTKMSSGGTTNPELGLGTQPATYQQVNFTQGGLLGSTQPAIAQAPQPAASVPDTPGLFQRLSTGLTAAIGELTNFAGALAHANSALGGAMGGAMGGGGMAKMLSGLPGLGMMGGPWGQAIGMGVGAIMGAITGSKNAAMSSELSMLNTQYTSIMEAFHSNTNNLQEAIQQMQELISEAQVDMANSKKGGQQFASLISQYSQQLVQLQDQQKSIISDMEIQLGIFSTPTGMQQFLTNLNNIIDTYDKFAGAAQNASQLAQANSWLTDSLSSYTQQMSNTFVNDEESGIQDALQLNTLLSERSTLISNLNDSIINVLEQGVLTRQQTLAQSKGQKIWEIESQHSLALSSINQEISLQEYKVAIETSLFNLAMTSMGLEAQLLALQEGQASQSLAAISALQELIQMLQGGNYNFSTISQILSQLGFGTAAGNIPPSGLNPAGGNTASTNAADAMIAAAYQSRATLGYATFRGANL